MTDVLRSYQVRGFETIQGRRQGGPWAMHPLCDWKRASVYRENVAGGGGRLKASSNNDDRTAPSLGEVAPS